MAKIIRDRDNGNGTYTQYTDDGYEYTYRFSDNAEVGRDKSYTAAAPQNNATKANKEKVDKAAKEANDKKTAADKAAKDWDDYLKKLEKIEAEASGFERWKIQQQSADAKKQRDNAYKIAQMQTQSAEKINQLKIEFDQGKWNDEKAIQLQAMSGYMTDGSNTLQRDEFEDKSRQWQSSLGLDAAKTAAALAQNPLNWFEAGSFYDEAAKLGYVGDAADMLRTTLTSGGGSIVTPQTNSLNNVLANLGSPGQPQAQGGAATYYSTTPGQTAQPGQPTTGGTPPVFQGSVPIPAAFSTQPQGGGHLQATNVASGTSFAPNSGIAIPSALSAQPSLNDQRSAFADEAVRLAQNANQWDAQQWASYSPTKQSLLKSAWKSRGLNPDDILFKAGVSGIGNEEAGRMA